MKSFDFEVGGVKYKARTLSMFDQAFIVKRLMPALKGITTPAILSLAPREDGGEPDRGVLLQALPAIADAIYNLSDDDVQTIIKIAAKGVERQNQGGAYSPLATPAGDILFQDLTLPQMLQIVGKVVELHLADFFPTAPSNSGKRG